MVKNIAIWGGLALMAAFTYLIWFPPQPTAKDYDRDAIEMCWKNQAKKSNSAGDSQFIAGACEMMESRFRKTYNVNP